MLRRWIDRRPPSAGLFNLRADQALGAADLSAGLATALSAVNASPPAGYYYGSHSLRIGGFDELVNLQFTKPWLMQRLDWSSEAMFQVYYDSRIVVAAVSVFRAYAVPSLARLRFSLGLRVRVHSCVCG